jgi:hypothetical protein
MVVAGRTHFFHTVRVSLGKGETQTAKARGKQAMKRLGFLVGAVLTAAACAPAHAAIVAISSPDAAYTSSTSVIPITDPLFTGLTSISDGTLTIDFDSTVEVRSVPAGGWATWSSPPESEDATPTVLFTLGDTSVELTFDSPLDVFGVEVEPNPFAVHTITMSFFDGLTLLGSVARPVDGSAGARLLAGTGDAGETFDRVVISSTADFAMAQPRYSLASAQAVPEPASLAIFGIGGLGLIAAARKRRAAKKVA